MFKDVFSQTSAGASAPTATTGGTNPKQIGLGSQIAAIDTMHEGGSLQTTNRVLDLAISGDGFFVVMDKDGKNLKYTRAGNFYMDKNGDLVNAEGKYLKGTAGVINIPTTAQSMSVGKDGSVDYVDEAGVLQKAGQLELAKFPNAGGLSKEGSNYYNETSNSGAPTVGTAGLKGIGVIASGALEMSNVDHQKNSLI